eukprot:3856183-Ditylum_brightwellii.AAC.1
MLVVMAAEVEQENDSYFANYGTTVEDTSVKVQIKPSKPSIVVCQSNINADALAVYVLRSHARI